MSDLGQVALQRIARFWQVESTRVTWEDDCFVWWPGSFRVQVRVSPKIEGQGEIPDPAWRVVVRTDLLRGVPVNNPDVRSEMASVAALLPTFAMICPPPEFSTKYPSEHSGNVWLQTTMYLDDDNAAWLPEFIGRIAILQPITAEKRAAHLAQRWGGTPHESAPPSGSARDYRDGNLAAEDEAYVPAGRHSSRWAGSSEFEEFVHQYGRSNQCYGNGDPTGMTLETPFGSDSSLIRVQSSVDHPTLGAGLLASLLVPLPRPLPEVEDECVWFNFFEATEWTGFPQLGSWVPRQHGDLVYPGSATFMPNLLFQPRLATNCATWHLYRTEWVKRKFYPDLKDLTMPDILRARYGQRGTTEN